MPQDRESLCPRLSRDTEATPTSPRDTEPSACSDNRQRPRAAVLVPAPVGQTREGWDAVRCWQGTAGEQDGPSTNTLSCRSRGRVDGSEAQDALGAVAPGGGNGAGSHGDAQADVKPWGRLSSSTGGEVWGCRPPCCRRARHGGLRGHSNYRAQTAGEDGAGQAPTHAPTCFNARNCSRHSPTTVQPPSCPAATGGAWPGPQRRTPAAEGEDGDSSAPSVPARLGREPGLGRCSTGRGPNCAWNRALLSRAHASDKQLWMRSIHCWASCTSWAQKL